MDTRRIARMVRKIEADGWVVMGGSRELLEWFVGRGMPVFAMFVPGGTVGLAGQRATLEEI